MCCFSGRVGRVSATRIFARSLASGEQALIYSMRLATDDDVAMILPLPVPPRPADDAVRFVNLELYPDIFDCFEDFFPEPPSFGPTPIAAAAQPLVVHDVGAYVASFVPSLADMGRLDARFRLPDETWERLPAYRHDGFAVFQLKRRAGVLARLFGTAQKDVHYHPMAFVFPRRDASALFFPTLHIHDGEAHPEAHFDHTLFCQVDEALNPALKAWRHSSDVASRYVDIERTAGLVDPALRLHRLAIAGMQANRDIVIALPEGPAAAA